MTHTDDVKHLFQWASGPSKHGQNLFPFCVTILTNHSFQKQQPTFCRQASLRPLNSQSMFQFHFIFQKCILYSLKIKYEDDKEDCKQAHSSKCSANGFQVNQINNITFLCRYSYAKYWVQSLVIVECNFRVFGSLHVSQNEAV